MILSVLLGLALTTGTALAATAYVVSETTTDGLLLQSESGDFWYVTTYFCSAYEGDVVVIDDFLGPSSFDEIIVPQTYGDPDTCDIDEAHEVTHKAYVNEELDDDKIILTLNDQQYLVEYGLGCGLSMWRYENKNIYLYVGGAYLNGVSDRIVLPNGKDCKVWDAREIEGNSGYSGSSYTEEELQLLLEILSQQNSNGVCPANSHVNPDNSDKCLCDSGYVVNSTKDGCVREESTYTCPAHSHENPSDTTKCVCDDGYELNSAQDGCVKMRSTQQSRTTPQPQNTNQNKQTFSDVPPEHHSYEEIEYLHEKGILDGYGDGSFKPGNSVNRAELLKILVGGVHASELKGETGCFPDVNDEWFAPYVCAGKRLGWVEGYPDGTFHPGNTVNRAEAIKIIVSSITGDTNSSESLHTDVSEGDWFSPYTRKALELGIEQSRGMFFPGQDLTRYAAASWIYNAISK